MSNNQKGFTLIELMIVVAIVGILLAVFLPMFVGQVSDGDRVGELIKFSNKGYFCKTYEGSIKISEGGGQGSDGLWDFTVTDTNLVPQIKELLGKRVKASYHQMGFRNPCDGSTTYDLIAIVEAPR